LPQSIEISDQIFARLNKVAEARAVILTTRTAIKLRAALLFFHTRSLAMRFFTTVSLVLVALVASATAAPAPEPVIKPCPLICDKNGCTCA